MNQPVLLGAHVHKSPKGRDVGDDAGQFHAGNQVVDGLDVLIELKQLDDAPWVAARFQEFFADVV